MLGKLLSSFVLIVGCANAVLSQQVRPLPNPVINIQCGQLSLLRTTGLVSPPANQPVPQTCTYRINAVSLQVCQMRLDFRQFSMAGPTVNANGVNGVNGVNGAVFQRCNDDFLTVNGVTICGENTGQHIYVPINPRAGERQLEITVTTRNGNGNGANGVRPNWNIAVNQIDCPLGQTRSLKAAGTAESSLMDIIRAPRSIFIDWLAPPGCLQYFVQPTGQFDSFNFNNGVGPYIGNMNYAICFRRIRASRTLKLIPTFFRLNNGNPNNPGIDQDCLEHIQTPLRSEDYLFIPNAVTDEVPPTRASLFCGQSASSRIITSTPPGPFMVWFNSDQVYAPAEEIGFRMQYEIV